MKTFLAPLARVGALQLWADTDLTPGEIWRDQIREAIDNATVAILLVTRNYLASSFILDNELPPVLSRAKTRGLTVLWLAVGYSLVDETEIAAFEALNDPKKPLESLRKAQAEKALHSACLKIRDLLARKPLATDVKIESAAAGTDAVVDAEALAAFWSAVDAYRLSADVSLWRDRVKIDDDLGAASARLSLPQIAELLEQATRDQEIQMGLAVLLGARVRNETDRLVLELFRRLLVSPFERVRYRVAKAATARGASPDTSKTLKGALLATLQDAFAGERREAVLVALDEALSALRGGAGTERGSR